MIARHFPSRQPSTMCAINRSARFRPHLDAGAGFGQRTSLIVGLGDYSGGDLVVERVEKNIRYAPLEFDGWRERHWTLPFKGERFSLVWFTPLTVAAPVPKPPLPPFVLGACTRGSAGAAVCATDDRAARAGLRARPKFLGCGSTARRHYKGRRPGLRGARLRRRRRAQVPDGVPRGSGLGPRVECLRRDGRRRAAFTGDGRARRPRGGGGGRWSIAGLRRPGRCCLQFL